MLPKELKYSDLKHDLENAGLIGKSCPIRSRIKRIGNEEEQVLTCEYIHKEPY